MELWRLSYRKRILRGSPIVFDDELSELEESVVVVLDWRVDVTPVAGEDRWVRK